jgi:hypothetical protein
MIRTFRTRFPCHAEFGERWAVVQGQSALPELQRQWLEYRERYYGSGASAATGRTHTPTQASTQRRGALASVGAGILAPPSQFGELLASSMEKARGVTTPLRPEAQDRGDTLRENCENTPEEQTELKALPSTGELAEGVDL